ncbi:unnamed protein product, partial [Amoebophrya sp. A120]
YQAALSKLAQETPADPDLEREEADFRGYIAAACGNLTGLADTEETMFQWGEQLKRAFLRFPPSCSAVRKCMLEPSLLEVFLDVCG